MLVLKTLVIGFAVLLAVAAIILIGFGVNRMGKSGFDLASLPVPDGCQIDQMTASGDRLILALSGIGDCRRILIADMKSGKLIGRFDLKNP
jgi:hypothetical protein